MTSLVEETENLVKEKTAYFGIVDIEHEPNESVLNIDPSSLEDMPKDKILVMKFALEQYLASLHMKSSLMITKLEINKAIFYRAIAYRRPKYAEEFLSKELLVATICNDRVEIKNMQNEILKLEGVVNSIMAPIPYIKGMIETLKSLAYQRN